MKTDYRAVRELIQEYMDWYCDTSKGCGWPSMTTIARVLEGNINNNVFRSMVPGYQFPRKSVHYLNRIIPNLPKDMQKIIRLKFNPLIYPQPTSDQIARALGVKKRTYDRRVEQTYQEVLRKYRILSNSA